jgi:integrase
MKPYSIKTTFVRLGQFHQWLMETDKIPPVKLNPWKHFIKANALLFKYSYQTERLKITYEEAKKLVESIQEDHYRHAAQQLLEGGLRYCELRTFDGEAVVGKGSKPRNVFLRDGLNDFRYHGSYTPLYKRLKALGLKPHTLRKLCATRFSTKSGVSDVDVCEVFGWESIETSKKYRQPQRRERLSALLME